VNCPNCSAAVTAEQKFCPSCGTRLASACTNCGAALPDGAAFCPACGTPVAGAASDGAAQDLAPSAAAVAESPVAERRLVSVLFCDLVGFTTASEKRDAEETRELLSGYYELCRERVARYGGTIEKFIGDAVMAVWGVPVAHEDDAERAVRAALELVAQVPQVLDGGAARAAVMSGEAAVTIGAEGQGMVAGDLVNTAARLQSVAEPDTVLVGESTMRAAERGIAFEAVGEQQLRGRELALPAWRALRLIAGVGGRLAQDELEPPFVGRELELRLLDELFRATHRERRLRLVSITGQAGIGKSRLTREFEKVIDGQAEDVWWHQGRCLPYGDGVTYWALAEMVRRRCLIAETDDAQTAGARLREALERFVADPAERERIGYALRALLGLETIGPGPREQGELFVLWRTFFERVAGDLSTVLIIEDLQWADDGLMEFLEHLLEFSRDRPIFVVTLSRPELLEARPTWGAGQRNFTSLHLEPLSDEAMGQLLEGLIPGLPAAARTTITGRAEGVPLYAVEIVRMLLADGTLEREANVFRLTRPLRAPAVPETLRGLLSARLDSVRPQERQLLQEASVLGQAFTLDALAAVSGRDVAALQPQASELVRREFLRLETDPVSPERGQYRFVQELVREVAYSTLAKRDRRTRHLAAARHFESVGEESLAGVLAEHYLAAWRNSSAGEERDTLAAQARVALRAASDRALRLFAFGQAATFLERSLEVAPSEGEQLEIRERIGDALSDGLVDLRGAEEHLTAALEIARDRGEGAAVTRLTAKLAVALLNELRVQDALLILEPQWRAVGEKIDGPPTIMLAGQLARAYMLSNQAEQAVNLADLAIEAADRAEMDREMVEAIITRGTSRALRGWVDGVALLYGAVELARRLNLPSAELRALNNVGVWLQDNDPAAMSAIAEAAIDVSRRTGRQEAVWYPQVAHDLSSRGDFEGAEGLLAEMEAASLDDSLLGQGLLESVVVAAVRGDSERVARLRESLDRLTRGITSHDQRANRATVEVIIHVLAGRTEEAIAVAAGIEQSISNDFRAHAWVGTAALLLPDRQRVHAVLKLLEAEKGRTPLVRKAQRLTMEAGLAAIEGRPPEAVDKARAASAAWATTGEFLEGSIALVAMLGVMDRSTAEVAALEQALRERWSGWDAPGFMAYMDRVLGTSGGEEAPGTPVASANTATTRVLARVKEDS
jgi:class 3 adenylate cyclase/tetratricopeptide (TPR) repeat protein